MKCVRRRAKSGLGETREAKRMSPIMKWRGFYFQLVARQEGCSCAFISTMSSRRTRPRGEVLGGRDAPDTMWSRTCTVDINGADPPPGTVERPVRNEIGGATG